MRSCWWLNVSLLLLLFIAEACNRRPKQQFVIIPQPPICSVNLVQGDSLVPLGTLDFPRYIFRLGDTIWTDTITQFCQGLAREYDRIVISDIGWIASAVEIGRGIGLARVGKYNSITEYTDLVVPTGLRIHALAFRDNVLFAGRSGGKEPLGYYDVEGATPIWQPLFVPDSVFGHGKAIDGLHTFGNRLIAVDDVVLPKWFIEYDISDPRMPKLRKVLQMPTLGLGAPIRKTVATEDWLITFSSTVLQWSGFQFASIYDAHSLELLANLDNPKAGGHGRVSSPSELKKRRVWNSIAIYGDWLLFAGDTLGVGRINIVSALDSAGESRVTECLPKYVLPADLSGKLALNVIPLEAVHLIAVVVQSEGKLETCMMRESDLLK